MKSGAVLLAAIPWLASLASAHAADHLDTDPVDYVQICDAFGAGFVYSPGTDTCLKVSGYVRFDNWFGDDIGDDGADWLLRTRARLEVTASTATEYGALTGFVRLQAQTQSKQTVDIPGTDLSYGRYDTAVVDRAYLELGGLKAGRFTPTFAYSIGYNFNGAGYALDPTTSVDQIAYTARLGEFSLTGALENPDSSNMDEDIPSLIAALAYDNGPFDSRLSGALSQIGQDDQGFAVQLGGTIELDQIAKGDAFVAQAGFASDAGSFLAAGDVSGMSLDGDIYNWLASGQHYWRPDLSSALTVSYIDNTSYDQNAWQVAASASYYPVPKILFGGEVIWQKVDLAGDRSDILQGLLRIERDFP